MSGPSRWTRGWIAVTAMFGLAADAGPPFEVRIVDPAPPEDPWMKAVGDLNGDGRPDLVLCGRGGPVVWYENPSWTRRTLSVETGTTGSSTGIALGDVDGNGSLDVVLANGVWFANPRPGGDAELDSWTPHAIDATTAHDIALADLDGDGDLDAVKRNQGATGDTIRVFRQDPGDTWTERTIPAPAGEGLAVGDLDADGDPDIAIAGVWYENDGDPIGGAWTPHTYSVSYTHPDVVVKLGNVGGSSRRDIVLSPAEAEGDTYRVSWFEAPQDAEGIWPERIIEEDVEAVLHGLAIADFDRDGRADLAVAAMHQGDDPDLVRVLLQDAGGSFSSPPALSSSGSHNLVAADLDADGRVDLFGANHDSAQAPDGAQATIWLNRIVPEPGTGLRSLAAVCALAALAARRRRGRNERSPAPAPAPGRGGPDGDHGDASIPR